MLERVQFSDAHDDEAARQGHSHSSTRMPHRAQHSRPRARREEERHALGSLLDTLHSPSDLVPPTTPRRHNTQPEYTAFPPPLPPTEASSTCIHAASVGLLAEDEELNGRQRTAQQAPASACTAAQPHPPPAPPPAAPPAGAGAAAAASTAEDHKRALIHALQKDIRVLEIEMSSRMSVLIERLDELLT